MSTGRIGRVEGPHSMAVGRRDDEITAAHVDDLLALLPALLRPGRSFTEPSPSTSPYPIYAADVIEFFRVAGRPPWPDYDYNPAQASRWLIDDDLVGQADLAQVRSMLTYCVRAERFGDGAWLHMLESGRIFRLLDRLGELRASLV